MRVGLRKPEAGAISQFLEAQRHTTWSYEHVGATRGLIPTEYAVDHNRVQLGRGSRIFERAVDALRRWEMFNLGWVTLEPRDTPLEHGRDVAVLARVWPAWMLNACRIVYTVDERDPPRRFGFAYGTLGDHAESGEERFTIEWQADDTVWYDILAFSRPQHPLVRMAKPVARMLQKRFARDSKQAMVRAATKG